MAYQETYRKLGLFFKENKEKFDESYDAYVRSNRVWSL